MAEEKILACTVCNAPLNDRIDVYFHEIKHKLESLERRIG